MLNLVCARCSSATVVKSDHFVQMEIPTLFCAKCVVRFIYEGFGTSDSCYLVFQPPGTYYQVSFTRFKKTRKHPFFDIFQKIQGACSYCTHETAKVLWFPQSQNQFSLESAQRLGRRCIYANLYEIAQHSSLWITADIYPEENEISPAKKDTFEGILEFFPLEQTSFESLQKSAHLS